MAQKSSSEPTLFSYVVDHDLGFAVTPRALNRQNHDCALWNTKKNTITVKQPNA